MDRQKAIFLHAPGDVSELHWQDCAIPLPGPHEIRLHHQAIGLNFIDIYHRIGLYPLPDYPVILGMEAAGIVDAVGEDVTGFTPGDRVAYGIGPIGAYAQYRVMPANRVLKLPDAVPFEVAAAVTLKGLTAHFLVRRTFIVNARHTVLIHAAAGGVGLLLCQWAKRLGARVIGTVGSEEKAALAHAQGCDHTILYKKEDIVTRVRAITDGEGVNAVYDAVGKDTFFSSLDCLMPCGIFISYGQASGPVPAIEARELQRRGSLFFTRPSLMDYMRDPDIYQLSAAELYHEVQQGHLTLSIGQSYYLSDVAQAHRDLAERRTRGASILLPES